MSTGVTSYAWAAEANRILVPLDGALYVLDGVDEAAAPPRRLFDPADARWAAVGSGPLLDPTLALTLTLTLTLALTLTLTSPT